MAERTLQSRVATSTALVSALVALVASAGAVALVSNQRLRDDDRRLLEAAQLFENEMGSSPEELAAHGDSEAEELMPVGLRLAVFAGERRLGGVPVTRTPGEPGCRTEAGQRSCVVIAPRGTIVVEAPASEQPLGVLIAVAALVALAAALGGALASRLVARWALLPLHALQARLASVTLEGTLELGPHTPTAEVEAFRAALTDLVVRLKDATERARVFAGGAAHELRTPLSTLSAELELAAHEASGAGQEAMARAQRVVKRLSVLVDHLLLLARGASSPTPSRDTLALEDLVRETVAGRSAAERGRLAMTFDDAGMVRGDPVLLAAVADNLVDNALKFDAGPVAIRVAAAGGSVTLEVRDSGPGLTAEQFAALRAPFTRGANQAGVRGHGLGLAIVHHAVELHGGSLRFEGPAVTVTLPAWTAG